MSDKELEIFDPGLMAAAGFHKDKDNYFKAMSKALGESCPDCDNSGVILIGGKTDEPEPEQCQFCYTNKDSVFNRRKNLNE